MKREACVYSEKKKSFIYLSDYLSDYKLNANAVHDAMFSLSLIKNLIVITNSDNHFIIYIFYCKLILETFT